MKTARDAEREVAESGPIRGAVLDGPRWLTAPPGYVPRGRHPVEMEYERNADGTWTARAEAERGSWSMGYGATPLEAHDNLVEAQMKAGTDPRTGVSTGGAAFEREGGATSTTPFDPLASPCLCCDYRGEGYWQRGTHARDCPWFHLGGEESRREALRVVIAGTVAEGEGLAAEREKRLGADLAATRLREALRDLVAACEFGPGESSDDAAAAHERATTALSAPPPSLDPLRDLVRAWRFWRKRNAVSVVDAAMDDLVAAYPFLREAEGEVGR